ncbi:twin-arginine translocation signal domain protein [hydrothermal vent metagenome]|uniref:Twin-arginine translocation signal domain protein n=1 Tax=hydrothermal vent metagenome TaxID=652676 RepID=A0A3B0QY89_9ZZZZ
MKRKLLILLAFLGLGLVGYFYISKDFKKTKDTIYFNATIVTLDEQLPQAQAMLVKDGIITALGTNTEINKLKTNNIHSVDLKGATILPGFIDSHTHVALSAFLESMVDLSGFTHKTNDEVWNYLKQNIKDKAVGEWIACKGLDPILTEDLITPNIKFLDDIAPNNPLIIISQSLHTYWANSKAFELAGITKDSQNPSKSSYYEKDATGNLTGLIAEQQAFAPFLEQLKNGPLSSKKLINSTASVLKNYAKNGNTTIVSAGLTINDAKPLRLYEHLSNNKPSFINQVLATFGMLPKRTQNPRHFIYIRYDRAFLLPKEKNQNNDFYNIIGIKHWYDGSPYTGSMYIEEPYMISEFSQNKLHIPEGSRGQPLIKKEDLIQFIKDYHRKGWQVAIHTQGDIANKNVLDAFSEVNKTLDTKNGRHRIEHCLLLSDSSLTTMKALHITPSFHINHLYYYGKALKENIIGNQRANKILPLLSAQNKGIKFSLHADQPMFESNPLRLIQTAVERQTKEGDTLGFNQRISTLNALKAMTINAAWQIHMEDKIGSLKKGKYADFVILDKNPLIVPIHKIQDIKILKIVVNGNAVE